MAAVPLFKHMNMLHRLVVKGRAALVAAVALTRQGNLNFRQGITEV